VTKKPLLVLPIVVACLLTACSSKKNTAATNTSPTIAPTSTSPVVGPTAGSGTPASSGQGGSTVTFGGFTINGATDLTKKPSVSGKGDHTPTKLEYKDFVVGSGAAATPTSTVTVQYDGFRLADGGEFQASWDSGGAIPFSLTGVVAGFTQGIGGTADIPPMKVGGRRMLLLPADLAYGANGTPDGSIPPNAAITFIVDLVKVQ